MGSTKTYNDATFFHSCNTACRKSWGHVRHGRTQHSVQGQLPPTRELRLTLTAGSATSMTGSMLNRFKPFATPTAEVRIPNHFRWGNRLWVHLSLSAIHCQIFAISYPAFRGPPHTPGTPQDALGKRPHLKAGGATLTRLLEVLFPHLRSLGKMDSMSDLGIIGLYHVQIYCVHRFISLYLWVQKKYVWYILKNRSK